MSSVSRRRRPRPPLLLLVGFVNVGAVPEPPVQFPQAADMKRKAGCQSYSFRMLVHVSCRSLTACGVGEQPKMTCNLEAEDFAEPGGNSERPAAQSSPSRPQPAQAGHGPWHLALVSTEAAGRRCPGRSGGTVDQGAGHGLAW